MKAERGNTLIEAMVALVILSCALVVLIKSYVTAITAAGVQGKYTEAIILLDEELGHVISKGFIKEMDRSYQKSLGTDDFEVRIKTIPVTGRNIKQVMVSILWPSGSGYQRSISAVTYLLDAYEK